MLTLVLQLHSPCVLCQIHDVKRARCLVCYSEFTSLFVIPPGLFGLKPAENKLSVEGIEEDIIDID